MQLSDLRLREANPKDPPHLLLWDNPKPNQLQHLAWREEAKLVSYRDDLLKRVDPQSRFLALHHQCDRLDERLEIISQAENLLKVSLPNRLEVEPFVQLWRVLQHPMATITDHDQSISPTEPQQKRQELVLQAIVERIGQIVETESERHQQLLTEAECGVYEVEIKRLLDQVGLVADLPPRHISALQAALQAAKIKQNEIVEQRKVANCLFHIMGHHVSRYFRP